MSTSIEKTEPSSEAERIFESIFHQPAPLRLVQRYEEARPKIADSFSVSERNACEQLFHSVRDLEAVEFACRLTGRHPLFCRLYRLVVMLAECEPEYRPFFLEPPKRSWLLYGRLFCALLLSVWKLAKGMTLVRRLESGLKRASDD